MTAGERNARLAAVESRIISCERELRRLRAVLAELTDCTCPIGFGAVRREDCPKHGAIPAQNPATA